MSKFKNTEELKKAYQELEREFTKKSQKLALYEKTNYVTLLNKEMDSLVDDYAKRRISDLEAKLAELEQENRELHTSINLSIPNQIAMKDEIERLHTCIDKRISELVDENDNLKQQLAENQKKKEDFKTMYFNKCLDYEHLHEKFDDKCSEFELKEYDYKQTIFEKDQDKISFAVEQLRYVQKYIITDEKDMFGMPYLMKPSYIYDYIDNQIAELKKGVE